MSVSTSIRKSVAQDWLNAYPELSAYKVNKLYKVVGPFILGVELVNLPYRGESYRPYFVCYSLWGSNEGDCMLGPLLIQEIKNRKGRQFNIAFSDFESNNKEAIECTKDMVKTSFDKIVDVKDLLQIIDSLFLDPYSMPSQVYRAKFYLALYIGDSKLINETMQEILNVCSDWDPDVFKFRYGTREQFIEKLQNDIINRESFLNQIELNQSSGKLKKLKVGIL